MPGPYDFTDPATLAAMFPGRFPDPNGPPSVTRPGITIPGIGALPPDVAAKLAPPPLPNLPEVSPPGTPAIPALPPLSPDMQAKFAAPFGPQAPPDQVVPNAQPDRGPNLPIVNPFPAKTKKGTPAASAAPAQPDDFAIARDKEQQGLAERKAAALAGGEAESQGAKAQADALADEQRNQARMMAAAEAQRKQDMADQQRMRGDLESAQKAYADSKIDQGRFWHDAGTGQKVLMGIGLALGAAAQAFNGKTNPALEMIQKAVAQDIQLQMADREKLGTVVGQKGAALDRMMAITRDNQATAQAAMSAGLQRVRLQVEQIASQTKSDTAKTNAQDLAGQLDMLAGQQLDSAAQGAWGRMVQQRQLAQQDRSLAIQGGHLALAANAQKEQIREFDLGRADRLLAQAQDDAMKGMQIALSKAAKNGATPEQLKTIQEIETKKLEQTAWTPPTVTKDPKTGAIAIAKPQPLTNQDGSQVSMTKENANEYNDKLTAAITYSKFADKLLDLRNKYGWESDARKSGEWREMQQLWSELAVQKKNLAQLGALSESDYDLLNKALGTGDPTEIRDISAGVLQGRSSVWDAVNGYAESHGYDGHQRIELPPTGDTPASNTPTGEQVSAAQETVPSMRFISPDDYGSEDDFAVVSKLIQKGNKAPTPDALRTFQSLALGARGGDPEALKAINALANNPDNEAMRRLARDAVIKYKLPLPTDWKIPGITYTGEE